MKKLFLVLSVLLFGLASFAWEPDPIKDEINSIPEYQEYFDDYSKRLYENFHPEKHFFGGWATLDSFYYTIFRDGTVKNISNFFYNNRYTDYCKKVIMETEAKPFPDAIKDDFIVIHTWLGFEDEKKLSMNLYGRTKYYIQFYWKKRYNVESVNLVDIDIEKKNYWNKLKK